MGQDLRDEHDEVTERLGNLRGFIDERSGGIMSRTARFMALPTDDQDDLLEQLMHMEGYEAVLARRVSRLDGDADA